MVGAIGPSHLDRGRPRISERKWGGEMACRGDHFALSPGEAEKIQSALDYEGLMAVVEGIEEGWDRGWLQETDKAWDAIHRCLTDGTLRYGSSPLHKCILGEVNLYDGDDYIVNLVEPAEVKEVATAIRGSTSPPCVGLTSPSIPPTTAPRLPRRTSSTPGPTSRNSADSSRRRPATTGRWS
jgi:hypothetical protein